jgi:uncharacterized protein YlxW (UPF0749 family)
MFVSADSSKPGFWVKTYPIGGGETDVVWMMDPVIPHLGAADLDPFVYWVATSANLRNGYAFDNITGGPWAYIDYTGMNEQFVHTAACFFYSGNQGRAVGGFNPQTGKLDSYYTFYFASNTPKGLSKYHEWSYKPNLYNATGVLQGKKTDYQNQLANKQSTLQALNSQISSAKLSLGSINASITAASSNLGSLSRTLQAKLTNTQSQITSKQSTLRSLQQEINQRQNTLNNYRNQINTLQNTINQKKAKRQSVTYEQNQLNNLQYRLQSEQTSLGRAQTTYNQTIFQ